ncbi:MAG TPA: hypothetical protein VII68_09235 [Casimicrobiaceae bacterium]|jgi:hypothetical protein
MKFGLALALSLVLAFVAACTTRPIMNVNDQPVVTSGKAATPQDVERSIVRAGSQLGWVMTPVRPGLVSGRLDLRTHIAVVDVPYDARSYSIKYKDSTNLNADGANIHKNYNGWIENLDRNIRAELLRL